MRNALATCVSTSGKKTSWSWSNGPTGIIQRKVNMEKYKYVYAEVLTGILHMEEDHISLGHSDEDCYQIKDEPTEEESNQWVKKKIKNLLRCGNNNWAL